MTHSHVALYLQSALLVGLLCAGVPGAADALSTTKDGMFQAIAQGPDSIAIYWKTEGPAPALHMNGSVCSTGAASVDPVSGFSWVMVKGLTPNTRYTFSLGKGGPTIAERTWSEMPKQAEYDLLIIGGTSSGTSAAVTAARLGMTVAMVEDTNRIGGMASNGLGATDMRNMSRANGFFEDFRQRVITWYGSGDGRFYESRAANAIFKDMVYAHPGITRYMKSEVVKPILSGNKVLGAVVRDNTTGKTGSLLAKISIDATLTGDFAAACGAPYRTGREPRTPEEPFAGVLYYDPKNEVILPHSTGEGDNKQQSYAYLMTWKDYGEKGAPLIEKPRFYDPETYRYSPEWDKTWNYLYGRLPSGRKFEINQHPFGTDWPSINHDFPEASEERRQEIADMYRDRALGYLYFMQNERGHRNLGLADDEYLDNGNFPHQLYIRECKRIMGEYIYTQADIMNARQIHRVDSITIGDYPMDSHATEDIKDPTRPDKGEGEGWLKSFTPWFQVPYGVLVPKKVENLLVTNSVSGTHWGYGALRMEPVRFGMGMAGAAAAYWSILYSKPLRQINPAWVQDKILSHDAYINWNSDVDRNTRHFKAINFLGARGVSVNEDFNPGAPLIREHALVVINRILVLEDYPAGLQKSPLPEPQAPITRGQFAQWLVEAKQKTSDYWTWAMPERPSYTDVGKDSPFFAAIETLRVHRITSQLFEDYEPGMFKPEEPITRGDAFQALFLAHRPKAMNYWRP